MKLIVPDYYTKFVCIAYKCRHNCCIGWEIDIDSDTYNYYKTVEGYMGEKLKKNISRKDTPHFILDKNERCPFLNKNNLCEIILNLGEEKLCDICSDHPRFRNFFENRTEMGLGLCCEEAARLIVTNTEKVLLINMEKCEDISENPEETYFFGLRKKVFNIVQDRTICFNKRRANLISELNIFVPDILSEKVKEKYYRLERLDAEWDKELENLGEINNIDNDLFLSEEFEIAFEQLLFYFIYRHMADGIYDERIRERIAFSILSTDMIKALCAVKNKTMGETKIDDLIDYSRRYSAEIEYSSENIDTMLDFLEKNGGL